MSTSLHPKPLPSCYCPAPRSQLTKKCLKSSSTVPLSMGILPWAKNELFMAVAVERLPPELGKGTLTLEFCFFEGLLGTFPNLHLT